jgi:hypothetical protein
MIKWIKRDLDKILMVLAIACLLALQYLED